MARKPKPSFTADAEPFGGYVYIVQDGLSAGRIADHPDGDGAFIKCDSTAAFELGERLIEYCEQMHPSQVGLVSITTLIRIARRLGVV